VGAFPIERPNPAEVVTEQNQTLIHDPYGKRGRIMGKIARQRDRLPIPPQQLAGGRTAIRIGEILISTRRRRRHGPDLASLRHCCHSIPLI
jgi:hypothetical protein